MILLAAGVHGTVFGLQQSGFRWKGEEQADRSAAERRDNDTRTPGSPLMGKSVRGAGWVIAIGLALPIFALPEVPRSLGGVALAALLFVVALFPWRHASLVLGVYGLMWLSCLCLLALLQAMPGAPKWIPGYLAVLSAVVLRWVLLKMKYRGHREIVQISSFETLLLGIALLVSLVVVPALGLGDGLRKMSLTVCLESIAFLLAMKILIRRQAQRNYVIAVAFMAALALICLKGLLSQRTFTDFVATPAGAFPPVFSAHSRTVFPLPPFLFHFPLNRGTGGEVSVSVPGTIRVECSLCQAFDVGRMKGAILVRTTSFENKESLGGCLSAPIDRSLRSRTSVKFFLTLGIFISAYLGAYLVRFEFFIPAEFDP